MDQVKVFLRQCVKYRFWIAFGISLLLPMIGYLAGSGAIVAATTAREGEIKSAQSDIQKYQSGVPPTPKYAELVGEKKAALSADVDATWRKLYALQEPLLKWPDVVEDKFRTWGRTWPKNVDAGLVQQTIIEYTIAYNDFVERVYKTAKPWNPEDGTGIVYVPEVNALLTPAPFSSDAPPLLGEVWAEQERLWVATALLDVVAKANDSVNAKDWDGAIIKQILSLEVGTPTSEDQKSLAKGLTLEPSPVLTADGVAPPPPPAAGAEGGGMSMGMMGGGATKKDVYSLKLDGTPPYKILPIRMTVLVDQSHLPDFLVGLENSPMAIQVLEPDVSRPSSPVVKPIYPESGYASGGGGGGYGMGMGMGGMSMMGRGGQAMTGFGPGANEQQMRSAAMGRGGAGRMGESEMGGMMSGMMGGMGSAPASKKGKDVRSENKAAERIAKAKKDAAGKKTAVKKSVDPYYNILEVTVYGQARFYNTPPVPPAAEPSTSAPAVPAAEAPNAEAPKPEEPAKVDPAPAKPDEPAKPAATPTEAPKAETPKAEAPKAEAPAPKS